MNLTNICNGPCTVPQIININIPINDLSKIHIYDECGCEYDLNNLEISYSLDNVTWSCYILYREALSNTIELNQDFFVRYRLKGQVSMIKYGDEQFTDYSTSIEGCFNFSAADTSSSSNTYNPYANMDNAVSLAQQLSESVSSIVGIPCYYIKLNPAEGSKDLTFKEYTLMNVQDIKQVKIVIQDNTMPSAKPEFAEWGLDFQTDWEVEVTKGSFATAFGNTAQPMEGDLVYIPMMKRMWMVNSAYEEKRDGFMWVATTFKLVLVKYQEKDSVDLGSAQDFVDSIVKNRYEDLFGEDEQTTLDSGEASTEAPKYAANKLYSVFESDATRKYITCDSLDIRKNEIYYRGTLISDSKYEFLRNDVPSKISYQHKYCGTDLAISFFIFSQLIQQLSGTLITIGNIKLNYEQSITGMDLYLNIDPSLKIHIDHNCWFFIILRWNSELKFSELNAYQYTYNENIPLYKLTKNHYYIDIDNPFATSHGKYNIEYHVTKKTEVFISNFNGSFTNFKLFDLYNDNLSELLQMYPTHQHLLINDTARRIVDLPGVKPA